MLKNNRLSLNRWLFNEKNEKTWYKNTYSRRKNHLRIIKKIRILCNWWCHSVINILQSTLLWYVFLYYNSISFILKIFCFDAFQKCHAELNTSQNQSYKFKTAELKSVKFWVVGSLVYQYFVHSAFCYEIEKRNIRNLKVCLQMKFTLFHKLKIYLAYVAKNFALRL